jgi:hypothetical protein
MAINRLNVSLSGVQPGGLAKVVPTSVAVGSGSGSVDSNGTVTFSGASSVSLNGCFSSTYDNYKIVASIKGSTNLFVNFRYRTTSDDSSANYYWQRQGYTAGGATTNGNGAAQTSGSITPTTTEEYGDFDLTLYNPFLSKLTIFSGTSYGLAQDYSNNANYHVGSIMNTTTSYTGLTLISSTGTITGTVRIYGYTN